MLRILNSLSSCSGVDVLLHSDSVVQHYIFFFPPDGWQWLSVIFFGIPSWKYRWMASVLFLSGLFRHLSRLVVHLLSFRRTVLHSMIAVFLLTYPGVEVTSRLFQSNSVGLRVDFIFLRLLQWIFRFPSRYCSQDVAVWKNFRKVRRSRCCSSRGSSLAILCWTCWSSASGSNPEWTILYVCGSRTSRSTFWLCSRVLYSAARLRKEVLQIFCDPRCCYPVTFRIARWFPRWSCFLALWILCTLRVRF